MTATKIGNPLDAATEKAVETMIRQYGVERVREMLVEIMHKATWNDWQRVNSLVTRMANRIRREDDNKRTGN